MHDLEEIDEDPRIEEMFKDEMAEYLIPPKIEEKKQQYYQKAKENK